MEMAELSRIGQRAFGGEFRLNEPMHKHTSWRAGGPADRAYWPRDLNDLARFVRTIPKDEPVYVVGLSRIRSTSHAVVRRVRVRTR